MLSLSNNQQGSGDSLGKFVGSIRVIYGTDVDKILEKLWDTSRGHLAASLIQHTECEATYGLWKASEQLADKWKFNTPYIRLYS